MGWGVWKNYLEASQGEGGVAEARQRGQRPVLSCSCGHYAKQAHWVAEASRGFCKCS